MRTLNCDVFLNTDIFYLLVNFLIPIIGNPLSQSGDPGFLSQIFLPTTGTSADKLAAGITAVGLSNCKRSMSSRDFTNITKATGKKNKNIYGN